MTTKDRFTLKYGDLDFSPAAQSGPVKVKTYGLRRGRPVPVVATMQTLLQDGAVEYVQREENRDVQVLIGIQGADSKALADFEALLRTEVARERNELTYQPPDGFGFPSVFDVLWADLQPFEDDGWDLDEVLRGRRLYTLALRCLPFARSVDEVVVTAQKSSASATVRDDGSATTYWTNPTPPGGQTYAITTSAGQIRYNIGGATIYNASIRWTGSDFTGTYVGIKLGAGYSVKLGWNQANYRDALSVDSTGTYWFLRDTSKPSGVPLDFLVYSATGNPLGFGGVSIYVDQLVSSSTVGLDSLLMLPVPGSVRTTGRYTIAPGSGSMDWAVVYSDPSMAGGVWSPSLSTTWPLAPAGVYSLWIDSRVGTVTTTVTNAGQTQTLTTTGPYTNPVTGLTSDWLPVGEVALGGGYDGTVGALTLATTLSGSGTITPTYRLFRKDSDASLTYYDGPALSTDLVIESPSVDRPFGGVWRDSVNAVADCLSWQDPVFAPGVTWVFVEGSNTNLVTTAGFYPRHLTHATC